MKPQALKIIHILAYLILGNFILVYGGGVSFLQKPTLLTMLAFSVVGVVCLLLMFYYIDARSFRRFTILRLGVIAQLTSFIISYLGVFVTYFVFRSAIISFRDSMDAIFMATFFAVLGNITLFFLPMSLALICTPLLVLYVRERQKLEQ